MMETTRARNNDGASAMSGIGDRKPPYNLEAEMAALGSCLMDANAVDDVAAIISPADFFRGAHTEVFTAILELRGANEPTDAIAVADALIKTGQYEKLGGDRMLRELCDAVPHAANAAYYAGIVREKAVARGLLDASTETIRDIYSNTKTASDLVCDAEERVFAISERDVAGVMCPINVSMDETMARMSLREKGELLGVSSGYPDIDAITSGFKPGEMTVLAARPGAGKTSLALDIAVNVASGGVGVFFVSLEMSRQSLGDRILSSQAKVDSYEFQRPWLIKDKPQAARIWNAAVRLSNLPIEFDYTAMRTVTQIAACARRMKRRRGLGLIVVDYLQLIDPNDSEGGNRQEQVAKISRDTKSMALSLGVPVLILSQLNRAVEQRPDKHPLLSDLRESGAIENDADLVWLLYRAEYYDRNDSPGMAEVDIAKNRNGATGAVKLAFEKEFTRFYSFSGLAGPIPDADTAPPY